MVCRWQIFGEFLRPVFSASRMQHISDLQENKGKNVMACPIPYSGYNKTYAQVATQKQYSYIYCHGELLKTHHFSTT